jgi:hypothetical protein
MSQKAKINSNKMDSINIVRYKSNSFKNIDDRDTLICFVKDDTVFAHKLMGLTIKERNLVSKRVLKRNSKLI